ncbi:MAG: hypothetical protein OSB69_20945, partial [Alphaproteobacteria bacterium]|nr:hypothetical protein [Alphaproteobacteria bacterium]
RWANQQVMGFKERSHAVIESPSNSLGGEQLLWSNFKPAFDIADDVFGDSVPLALQLFAHHGA